MSTLRTLRALKATCARQTHIPQPTKVLCNVEFDLTLANHSATSTWSGIGIWFGTISLGDKHNSSNKDTSRTSIMFNVISLWSCPCRNNHHEWKSFEHLYIKITNRYSFQYSLSLSYVYTSLIFLQIYLIYRI